MNKITKEYLKELDKKINESEELEFIPLTFDYALKNIAAKNQKIFRKFIIETTHLENITDKDKLAFLDKELIKSTAKEQAREVDFYLRIGDDIVIDVEMNRKRYKYVKERNTVYMAKLITLKLEVNTNYKEMQTKEFYQVNINSDESKKEILPERKIELRYCDNNEDAFPNFKILLKNLDRYRELWYNKSRKLRFDEVFLVALTSKNYIELYNVLETILSTDELNDFIWSVIEMNEDNFILHNWQKEKFDKLIAENMKEDAIQEGLEQGLEQGMELGLEKGRETKAVEVIKAMLNKKMSHQDISDISGKSIKEIEEIEKSMK